MLSASSVIVLKTEAIAFPAVCATETTPSSGSARKSLTTDGKSRAIDSAEIIPWVNPPMSIPMVEMMAPAEKLIANLP
jgi:hypothetical protein